MIFTIFIFLLIFVYFFYNIIFYISFLFLIFHFNLNNFNSLFFFTGVLGWRGVVLKPKQYAELSDEVKYKKATIYTM